eukprot:5158279-Alexandrium_andersonii.AAC.1
MPQKSTELHLLRSIPLVCRRILWLTERAYSRTAGWQVASRLQTQRSRAARGHGANWQLEMPAGLNCAEVTLSHKSRAARDCGQLRE